MPLIVAQLGMIGVVPRVYEEHGYMITEQLFFQCLECKSIMICINKLHFFD